MEHDDITITIDYSTELSTDEFYGQIPDWPYWLTTPSRYEGGRLIVDGYFTKLGEGYYSVAQAVGRNGTEILSLRPEINVYRLIVSDDVTESFSTTWELKANIKLTTTTLGEIASTDLRRVRERLTEMIQTHPR